MDTLLLDRSTWDLLLDAEGNIAVASGGYAIGQDIASAVRVFLGECYYNTAAGLPYMQNILGRGQVISVFESQVVETALAVPGCADARCIVSGLGPDRRLTGVILYTTTEGESGSVNL